MTEACGTLPPEVGFEWVCGILKDVLNPRTKLPVAARWGTKTSRLDEGASFTLAVHEIAIELMEHTASIYSSLTLEQFVNQLYSSQL